MMDNQNLGSQIQRDANLQAIAIALGQIVKALGTTSLPTAIVSGTAGASAGYITIAVGGTAYKVPIYAVS